MKGGRRAQIRPIGVIRSAIKTRSQAPKQGSEGAPDAWLEISPLAAEGLLGLAAGDEIIVMRSIARAHPSSAFGTFSPHGGEKAT